MDSAHFAKVFALKNLNAKNAKIHTEGAKDEGIMTENELSSIVINAGLKVHKTLGPGLLESAYEECLYYELQKSGVLINKQKALPLVYEGVKLDAGYRIDLLIENKLIVEIKAVDALNDLHLAQVLTYLRISGCRLGLLINFNTVLLKDGIRRVVNKL
ncbi:MAG: GxxExxY protein [Planctomycetaceae bacterium]|nr:GxxExxY protein [Planctomycetaceae bacterium]